MPVQVLSPPPVPVGLDAVVATFGQPKNFVNDKALWEQTVLASASLPTDLPWAGDPSQSIHRVRAHHLIVDVLAETLMACLTRGVPVSRMAYGGTYCWRLKRGLGELSLHAWGIAVDVDPANNPLGVPWADDGVMLDPRIIETFKLFGWQWGGDFAGRADPQHFQWASGV